MYAASFKNLSVSGLSASETNVISARLHSHPERESKANFLMLQENISVPIFLVTQKDVSLTR